MQQQMLKENTIERLRGTLGKMEIALGAITEAIVWTDEQGNIQWCNTSFDEFVGRSHLSILGQPILELFPLMQEQQPLAEQDHPWHKVMFKRSKLSEEYEYGQDEDMRVIEIDASRLDIGNQGASAILVIKDITDEVKALEMKNKLMEMRIAMETKTNFTSTVSHELRTPLAAIKTAIDIVMSGSAGDLTDNQNKFLTKAKSNIDRLKRLIDDILDLSRLESGKIELHKEPQNIRLLLEEAVDVQKSVAQKKKLMLRLDIKNTIPHLNCDADKLNQVFSNLMNNAIKFTETGEITISAEAFEDKNYVEFSIKDTGEGIDQEHMDKLFEKFQQLGDPAKRKTGGTGLGLAICQEIVQQHGGKIWAESQIGEGSTFFFTLPILERSEDHE